MTEGFIRNEIIHQLYEISLHADDERMNDGLTINQVEHALLNGRILEHYPDDPRGESCLFFGFTQTNIPVHVVCGKNRNSRLLFNYSIYSNNAEMD